ncbi:hypothetical protein EAF04_008941 [Stromatinia cepivora]|nr:hypothetical protein EAF04_008941 [Stromatinia cepivora]
MSGMCSPCLETQLQESLHGQDNPDQISPRRLNEFLSLAYNFLQTHPEIKGQLNFTLTKRSFTAKDKTNKGISQFHIEQNTAVLLANSASKWNRDPASFWGSTELPFVTQSRRHLIVQCLRLPLSDAHSCILRRFYCLALTRLTRPGGKDEARIVVRLLLSESDQDEELLVGKVEHIIQAGARYHVLARNLGLGSLLLLGEEISYLE